MPTTTTLKTRIWLDDEGRAWIDDTKVRVTEVVLDKLAYGSSPEELHEQYPHLSLAQIYAALSYYYDHKEEMDAEIARQLEKVDRMRAQAGETPFEKHIRALGLRP
ncbi:MAG: DUF433 domain-containing protein [Armatimonadetes bacterium]|nr:DUF433 domain-containing protein [Armatimonadota bacterium]